MAFLLAVLELSLREEKRRIAGKVAFPLSEAPSHIFFKIARGARTEEEEYMTSGCKCDERGFRRVVHPRYRFIHLPGNTLVKYSADQNQPFLMVQ